MKLLLSLALLLTVLACASRDPDQPSAPLLAGQWTVEEIGGSPVIEGSEAYLEFGEDSTLSGNASCNRISGTFTGEGSSLVFSQVATTRMMGTADQMAQETALLAALAATTWVGLINGRLVLMDAEGTELLAASLE